MAIDSVTLEILKNHSRAAAESMAFTLYRTAHSAFVKETEDFTTGLTTPEGETFATPTELGATWFVGLNYKNVIDLIDPRDTRRLACTFVRLAQPMLKELAQRPKRAVRP